jgi:hypothetical protein
MMRSVIVLAFAMALSACASKPVVNVPEPPKPKIRSISVVPATNPKAYTLGNDTGAVGLLLPPLVPPILSPMVWLGYKAENRSKAKLLTEKISALPFYPGMDFTNAVVSALRDQGYTVKVLENVVRDPTDSTVINYDKLDYSDDAILHLYFTEIGIHSAAWSSHYVPRVNATGTIFVKGHAHYLYEETIYFGADAKDGRKTSIIADAKFAYPDFDFVLKNLDAVLGAFSTGIREAAKRMSEHVHAVVK